MLNPGGINDKYGHKEVWEGSMGDCLNIVHTELIKQNTKNSIPKEIMNLAISFMCRKYDNGWLEGTAEYEVSKSVEEAYSYYYSNNNEPKTLERTVPLTKWGDDSITHEDVSPDTVSYPIEYVSDEYCNTECEKRNIPGACDKCPKRLAAFEDTTKWDGTV